MILSSVRLFVCLWRCALWLNDTYCGKSVRKVNKKCPHRNTILQLLTPIPHRPYSLKLSVPKMKKFYLFIIYRCLDQWPFCLWCYIWTWYRVEYCHQGSRIRSVRILFFERYVRTLTYSILAYVGLNKNRIRSWQDEIRLLVMHGRCQCHAIFHYVIDLRKIIGLLR